MEAGVSQKLPDCVKRTQRLAHNQYNQRKKDLLYTSPKHQHLHAVKVYAMSDRAGMVVPSDEDTWEGEKSARGWGGRMGLLLSHFLLPLTPNHALTQYSLKSLYTFLKVKKKIKEEEVTKWQYPSSLKTVQVLPTTFLHMLLASCQSPWSRWCQGRWKPCLQLPLRKCVTTWEEQKEIWAQPSLFATVYLWGSSSIQAQPDREIPVLQLVRYSRLVTKPHTIQMPSKVAGAGKHSIHWSYHIP